MSNKKERYAYRYFVTGTTVPLQRCPHCQHDLARPEAGITVVLYYGDGKSEAGLVEVGSSLDSEGRLIDRDGQVAAGHHSTTLCFGCHAHLGNWPMKTRSSRQPDEGNSQ